MAQEVLTEIELDAPIDIVWGVLADIESWPSWTRIFGFKFGKLKTGGRAVLMARVGPGVAALPIRFDVVDRERELRWHGGIPGVVHGSHYLKLEDAGNGRTRLIHGEDFSGLVINATWGAIGKQLPGAYKAFNRDLARRVDG